MALPDLPYYNYLTRTRHRSMRKWTWQVLCLGCRSKAKEKALINRHFEIISVSLERCEVCNALPEPMPREPRKTKFKAVRQVISDMMYGKVDEKGQVIQP